VGTEINFSVGADEELNISVLYDMLPGVYTPGEDGGYHPDKKMPDGNALRHGKGGSVRYADGLYYEGSFFEGKWHSWDENDKGKIYYPIGNGQFDYYEGQFCMGVKHGVGCLKHADGTVVQGTWVMDRKHG